MSSPRSVDSFSPSVNTTKPSINNNNDTNTLQNNIASHLIIPPELHELTLDDVVQRSVLSDRDTNKQIQNIVKAFNRDSKDVPKGQANPIKPEDVIVSSWWRGKRLKPGNWFICHRNQTPIISADHENKLAKAINMSPDVVIEEAGRFPMNKLLISVFGVHIVNVPNSAYAKAFIGTAAEPRLLSTGVHVIHDPTFKLFGSNNSPTQENNESLVNASEQHINHRSIHIIRVSPGTLAKIWIGVKTALLPSKEQPYVFNNALFRLEGFVSENEVLISHGNQHIVRVPSGKIAKVWVDNKAILLEARSEPYLFHTPYFSVARGPEGLAGSWFCESTQQSIIHGSIKRLLPSTGQVAVCYESGKLFIVHPSADGEPFVKDSPLFEFDGFLDTNIATEVFPSERTKKDRKRENAQATSDQINYEIVVTKDSLKLGVKCMISYRIADADKLLKSLKRSEILDFIENVAVTDLARSIQQTTSQEFLSFNAPNKPDEDQTYQYVSGMPSAPPMESFVDRVKRELATDLKELGISLLRLNIESPKVLDAETSKSMEQQSLMLARAAAEESVLETQFKIARTKANQQAEVKRIEQEQKNQIVISAAQAELRAAEARSKVVVLQAQAEKEAADLRGNQYKTQTELYAMDMLKIQTQALQNAKIQLIVTPDELRKGIGSVLGLGLDPFNRALKQ